MLDRPGNAEIQLDLFFDYRTNVALYPAFQDFFCTRQPPTFVAWGANDAIFPPPGARAFLRDLPDAEEHLIDSGHFALEDKLDDYVELIHDFLGRVHDTTGSGSSLQRESSLRYREHAPRQERQR